MWHKVCVKKKKLTDQPTNATFLSLFMIYLILLWGEILFFWNILEELLINQMSDLMGQITTLLLLFNILRNYLIAYTGIMGRIKPLWDVKRNKKQNKTKPNIFSSSPVAFSDSLVQQRPLLFFMRSSMNETMLLPCGILGKIHSWMMAHEDTRYWRTFWNFITVLHKSLLKSQVVKMKPKQISYTVVKSTWDSFLFR